jgi:hypothetical protein
VIAKVLTVAVLVLHLAVTPASAQSHVAAGIAGWRTYTGTAMGFEARLPPDWRVRSAAGTGPETVSFDAVVQPGQSGMSVQFWVQRNANPTALPIATWYATQVRAMKSSPPPVTTTSMGGRTAVRREVPGTGAKHFSYYVALNATDVFQVTLQRPASQQELDATSASILSTVRFLK